VDVEVAVGLLRRRDEVYHFVDPRFQRWVGVHG